MKRLFALCSALLLLLLAIPVYANNAQLPRVVDNADLLTNEEEKILAEKIGRLIDLGYDAVLLTMEEGFGGKTETDYADDYYDEHGYGVGEDNSGFLFLVNMTERRLYISTCGKAIPTLTAYGRECLFDTITGCFSAGAYFSGFSAFLTELENTYIPAYNKEKPIDVYQPSGGNPSGWGNDQEDSYERQLTAGPILVCCLIGFGISLLIFLGVRSGMKTARVARTAGNALKQDSFRLTANSDIFLYSRTQRIARNTDNGSGGGSSTHTSSGGVSHGGGGRSF